MRSTLMTAAASLLSLGTLASAAVPVAKNCPTSNVCYSINIPDVTAKSGTGDIYFQINASTSYSYAALGQGSGMIGANIFVIYPSANGKNVTLSTRQGTAYRQPLYTSGVQAELLEGSGVADGMMTANIKCSSCNKWEGGSMDFSQSSTSWIYALGSGTPFESDAKDATITYHGTSRAPFTWDLSPAKGGDSLNPFLATVPVTTTTTMTAASSSSFLTKYERVRLAHGAAAGTAFVGLFPIGAILIRLAGFKGLVWVHAAIQGLAYVLYIAAFGLGLWMWTSGPLPGHIHPIIGCVIFGLLLLQPLTGLLHHRSFVKRAKNASAGEAVTSRTFSSYIHLFSGRFAIILGIINGGLGLWLAQVMGSKLYAYSVLAAVMGFAYIVAIVIGEWRRSKQLRKQRQAGSASPVSRSDAPMEQVQVRPKRSNAGSGSDVDSPTVDKQYS